VRLHSVFRPANCPSQHARQRISSQFGILRREILVESRIFCPRNLVFEAAGAPRWSSAEGLRDYSYWRRWSRRDWSLGIRRIRSLFGTSFLCRNRLSATFRGNGGPFCWRIAGTSCRLLPGLSYLCPTGLLPDRHPCTCLRAHRPLFRALLRALHGRGGCGGFLTC
jgi:hypothetical protein